MSREFETWFRKQFGPSPARKDWKAVADEIAEARAHLNRLEANANELLSYERRRDAALKAWCAACQKERDK